VFYFLKGMFIVFSIILLVMYLSAEALHADSFTVNLASKHFNATQNYNEKNPGLGYIKDINRHWQVKTGFYKNSYNNTSVYLAAGLKHEMKHWAWGIDFGFVTGYTNIKTSGDRTSCQKFYSYDDDDDGVKSKTRCKTTTVNYSYDKYDKYQFMILPNITWKINKKHALQFGFIPNINNPPLSVVTVQYQYRFNKGY